ncbi:hypothetical protein C8A05DRAFT_43572 [Staphylotrichum tortipilum]|uniref:Uncharacterized protein n=1 Tax=Staphylotrichum tortipilum TaxID=2831512 RepID=A0AAN6MLH5_9PEZI|nr:hypothetical protein C8A05DRAFT_43572 [Staphylotrichum longicolle]
MASGNSWLARQRKSDLVELAEGVGLKNYEGMRKSELELALDEHLSDNAPRYQADPRFQDYFKSRARAGGSPVKKESATAAAAQVTEVKVSRRRTIKPVEEPVAAADDEPEEDSEPPADEPPTTTSTATALARTPARALALASRLQLPATPADVAQAVESGTVAVRARVATLYADSGLTEATQTTRDWLSTVHSIVSAIALFELYRLRREVLPDRYAFTIPAVPAVGVKEEWRVFLPDMFALVTAGFWGPTLTWLATSVVVPGVFGYFFNLGAAHRTGGRGRKASQAQEYAVDPLTFSVVKAVLTYVVYAQGVTFGGLVNPESVGRINGALYSGWQGVLVGTAVSTLASVYDAVLSK